MKIIKQELFLGKISIIVTALVLALFIYLGMIDFHATSAIDGGHQQIFEAMPKIVKALFGIGNNDLSSPVGYYLMLQLYIIIITSVIVASLSYKCLYKEEKKKIYEFLNTRPCSRKYIFRAKLITSLIITTIYVGVITIATLIFVAPLANNIVTDLLLINLGLYFIQIAFVFFGLFLASRKEAGKANILISIVIFAFYLLKVIADMFEQLDFIYYINPFTFFDLKNDFYVWLIQLCLLMIGSILLYIFGLKNYQRKDFS